FWTIEAYDISSKKEETTFILREPGDPKAVKLYEPGDNRNPVLLWSN
ncbi:MAG: hypothetical protein GY940_30375, partial [bacterium]|nr:hypothetical protein [bacterium]